jgi:phosphoglycolate phosphatase
MLAKRNMGTVSMEEYRTIIEFPIRNLYFKTGFDLENENYGAICDEYIQNYIDNVSFISLQKDAGEVLEGLRNKGFHQHIVSASGSDILIHQLESYGLRSYFTYILGQSDNHADSKEHLAKRLLDLTGCPPEEVLFIGDTIHDFEVASRAGFHCRLVANGHCSKERLEATGSPVYDNLTALYQDL